MILKLKVAFEVFESFIRNIYDCFISIIKILFLSKFGIRLPQANEEICVVLGNGPSLNESLKKNKNFFLNHELFCVNLFPKNPEFVELKPGNLVWLDSGFYFFRNIEELQDLRPDISETIDALIERTKWPLKIYLPRASRKAHYLIEITKKNRFITIVYFNYTIVKGFNFFQNFCFKWNLGMPQCENVLGASLFLAINNGFKLIYLFGADHSWIENIRINKNNEMVMKQVHYYSNKEEVAEKKVIAPGSNKSFTMVDLFKSQLKAFNVYYILNRYSKYIGAKIINASEYSYVDAFEREEIKP